VIGRAGVGDTGEHVEKIALRGVDELPHRVEVGAVEPALREFFEQRLSRRRKAPQASEFVLVLEQARQLALLDEGSESFYFCSHLAFPRLH
jgi:hypothetical protein